MQHNPSSGRKSVLKIFDPYYESPSKKDNSDRTCTHQLVEDDHFEEEILDETLKPEFDDNREFAIHLINWNDTHESYDTLDLESQNCNEQDYALHISKMILDNIVTNVTNIKIMNKENCTERVVDATSAKLKSDLELQLKLSNEETELLKLKLKEKEKAVEDIKLKATQSKLDTEQLMCKLEQEENFKQLEDAKEQMQLRERDLLQQIEKLQSNENRYKQLMSGFENMISMHVVQIEKLKLERNTAQKHLSAIEIGFSDLHQKYVRSKVIIEECKAKEELLKQNFLTANEQIKINEEKYECLKTFAQTQMDKFNKELVSNREEHDAEINKLFATVKCLDIKHTSLVQNLDQKTEECAKLTALFNELTKTFCKTK